MNCCKLLRRSPLPGCEARTRCPIALVFLSFAGVSFAGACAEDDTSIEPVFTPEVIGTAGVPLSDNNQVAVLADGRVACVIESYEERVHCVDREGGGVGSYCQSTYGRYTPEDFIARVRED